MATSKTYIVEGYNLGSTEKAVRFEIHTINSLPLEDGDIKIEWFPLSQVDRITEGAPGSPEMDSLRVSEWILKTKELI